MAKTAQERTVPEAGTGRSRQITASAEEQHGGLCQFLEHPCLPGVDEPSRQVALDEEGVETDKGHRPQKSDRRPSGTVVEDVRGTTMVEKHGPAREIVRIGRVRAVRVIRVRG